MAVVTIFPDWSTPRCSVYFISGPIFRIQEGQSHGIFARLTHYGSSLQHPVVYSAMAVDELISDPTLLPLLETSRATVEQTVTLLSWLAENHNSDPHSQPDLETRLEFSRHQKRLLAHLAQLRGQNRRAAFEARATKQETANARHEVDRLLLQLQNLYYEQRHLMGEIGACEGYEYVDNFVHLHSFSYIIAMQRRHKGLIC